MFSAGSTATVPGTVLASYVADGAVPDPNYEDWHLYISDNYFFLMPGESKEVEVKTESLKGRLKLVAEGLNL